jgi:hypothetical protein
VSGGSEVVRRELGHLAVFAERVVFDEEKEQKEQLTELYTEVDHKDLLEKMHLTEEHGLVEKIGYKMEMASGYLMVLVSVTKIAKGVVEEELRRLGLVVEGQEKAF